MAMTILVTRNAPERVRGFLTSCMCEIAPGVYTAPRMNPRVRERVWEVVKAWLQGVPDGSAVMSWPDGAEIGGQAILTFGTPRIELREHCGIYLACRPASDQRVTA